ncbi:MAG: hypothetical protein CSB19_02010 [Clostridiales bacterium]|nr:MAG: hypothetical protein CSB19_02010 [Clostridiales bacterium]
MKNKFVVMALVGALALSGCSKQTNDENGGAQPASTTEVSTVSETTEPTTIQTTCRHDALESNQKDDFLSSIVYSNLADEATQREIAAALLAAGISQSYVTDFLNTVDDYNQAVGDVGLVKEGFVTSDELAPFYDVVAIDEKWFAAKGDFIGYNCRMTAMLLFDDLVSVDGEKVSDNKMLFMDEDAILYSKNGRFNDQFTAKFRTFFGDVKTPLVKDVNVHLENVQNYWRDKKVSFKESDAKLITMWQHSDLDDNLFIGHTGVLLPNPSGGLFFVEKLSFQEPYQVLKFENRQQVSDYLMGKYDLSYGQATAKPFIMENDKLIDGYRPNPNNME